MADKRRRMVAGACVRAKSLMYSTTAMGAAGSGSRPWHEHQAATGDVGLGGAEEAVLYSGRVRSARRRHEGSHGAVNRQRLGVSQLSEPRRDASAFGLEGLDGLSFAIRSAG